MPGIRIPPPAAAAVLVLAVLLLPFPASGAPGEEPPRPDPAKPAGPAKPPADEEPPAKEVKDVPDAAAKEALDAFAREFDTEDLDYQIEAVRRLRKVVHPEVADRLLGLALSEDPKIHLLVKGEGFRGLRFQKTSAKAVSAKVSRWLGEAAKVNAKMKARGDYGVLVDVKTGEVDTESPEGQAALRNKRDRGKMLAEAVKLVRDLGYRDSRSVEVFTEFLSDGNDDLVALVLRAFGEWKEWTVLKELADMYDIYPEPDSFETGSVSVDTGAAGSADQQAAKRRWMAKFGDPDRRRARPVVHRALVAALKEITGQEFKAPRDLREYMKQPDVKRKMKGR
jgi:hypothetical protein